MHILNNRYAFNISLRCKQIIKYSEQFLSSLKGDPSQKSCPTSNPHNIEKPHDSPLSRRRRDGSFKFANQNRPFRYRLVAQ